MIYIILVVLVLVAAFLVRVWLVKEIIDSQPYGRLGRPMVTKEMEKEWYELSWSGKNPLRVIGLAMDMGLGMSKFNAAKHLASSLYSQVKFLVKKGHLPTALVFFIGARRWAKLALLRRGEVPQETLNPIDLEVLGAPDFLLAKMPYVGGLIGLFGFKKRALEFLIAADIELEKKLKELGASRPDPITAGLIWSKLYALTGDEHYKNRVRIAELTGWEDKNQLTRIAKHLGFKTLEELYKFLVV